MSKKAAPTKAKMEDALDELQELRKLLEDRICETHQIKGQQGARHAFILYRDKVHNIQKLLNAFPVVNIT